MTPLEYASPPAARISETAIRARNIGKMYHIYSRPQDRLKQMLFWRFGRNYGREFWALRDLSFDVAKGETVGIIGRNGSGKSTLLQIVTGTLAPTMGEVQVNGRIAALLELGSGFNPEFTGRENVYLNGAILGLSREEMAARFSEIAAFADIGDFIDQPVKTYSSGMVVRLAFAVQAHVQAEILIVDEALSVGDVFFQQKCFTHIRRLQRERVTIMYVSHDLVSIQNICGRAILMEEGAAVFEGNPHEAVNRYYRVLGEQIGQRPREHGQEQTRTLGSTIDATSIMRHTILRENGPRHGMRGLELVAARVCDTDEEDTLAFEMLGTLTIQTLLRANRPIATPIVGFHLYDRLGNLVYATGTIQMRHSLPPLETGESLVVCFQIELRVQPGEYTFNLMAAEPAAGDDPNIGFTHDSHELLGPLSVLRPREPLLPFYGIAQLPTSVSHEFKGRA